MTTKDIDIRVLALETLLRTEKNGAKLNDEINAVLKEYSRLPKEKRAFYTRLVEGTVEQRIFLDYVIDIFSKTPVKKMKPAVRNILRMSVYQIMKMDSVPERAAVNEAVSLTAKKGFSGLKGFVNGILRNIIRQPERIRLPDESDPVRYISVRYSMPEFIVKQWTDSYGADVAQKICESFLEDKKTSIRISGGEENAGKCVRMLESEGVMAERAPYLGCAYYISGFDTIMRLRAFKEGLFAVQDVSSMLAVEAAGIQAGESVLDVCAAPGGKSLFAAEKTGSGAVVISRDISEKKIRLIEENAARCGAENIKASVWDAAVFDPALKERVDVVLVDAPCSGYGIIGRKPDIKYNADPQKQESLAAIQRNILDTAAGYVRPGGRLIYSTCTISKAENEENVKYFLEKHPFKPLDLTAILPAELADTKRETAKNGYIQLIPGIDRCDGFFVSGFVREI